MSESAEFDRFAAEYDAALQRGLSVVGESKEYFAQGRIAWLSQCVAGEVAEGGHVIDFGCGTGSSTPYLLELLGATRVTGIDVSHESLALARQRFDSTKATFHGLEAWRPDGSADIVYCNGVFHHIAPERRNDALRAIRDALRPRGLFALWENNPWNPGTRYIMSRVEFDREAILVSPRQAQRLLRDNGFEVVRLDYLFIFPHFLRALRPVESWLCKLPLGGQYQALARAI